MIQNGWCWLVQGSVVKFLSSCLATPDKIRTCHSNLDYTTILSPEKRTESFFLPKTRSLHFSIENDVHSLVRCLGLSARGFAFFARMRTIGTLSQGTVRKAHKRLLSWDQSSPKRWNTLMGDMSWTDIRPLCSSCIVSMTLLPQVKYREIQGWEYRIVSGFTSSGPGFATWMISGILYRTSCPWTPCPWTPWTPSKRATPDRFSVKAGKSHRIWLLRFNAKLNLCRTIVEEKTSRLKRLVTSRASNPMESEEIFINIWVPNPTLHIVCPDAPPGWSELEGQSGAMWICHC